MTDALTKECVTCNAKTDWGWCGKCGKKTYPILKDNKKCPLCASTEWVDFQADTKLITCLCCTTVYKIDSMGEEKKNTTLVIPCSVDIGITLPFAKTPFTIRMGKSEFTYTEGVDMFKVVVFVLNMMKDKYTKLKGFSVDGSALIADVE